MNLKIIALSLVALSYHASASDVLQCDYAKSNLADGANAQMIPGGKAAVEFDGKSFKATRPWGSFIISPNLTDTRNGMLFRDDSTKVFAASPTKTDFAVSDRIAKTTEQWANCKIDEVAATKQKADKEIAEVEKLTGNKAKNYFLKEKHAFTTNCLTWDDVTMITGKYPAMIIGGGVHMGKNPIWDGREYTFTFNGGSMMARFVPSEPRHKLTIQAGDKFYGCGPSAIDYNYK